jgi:hypothetical protein
MQIVDCLSACRTVRNALLVSAAVGTAGCSGDPPAQSSAVIDFATIRACELLTPDDIESATGIAVGPGKDESRMSGRLPVCNWPRAGSDTDVVLSLMVMQPSYSSFDRFMAGIEDTELADTDIEEVPGVGRFGVWMPEMRMMQAYGEAAMVQTYLRATSGRDAREAASALAGTALERIR